MHYPITRARPGDVVAVNFGLYEHVGILSDGRDWRTNQPLVFSATRRHGCVAEEPLAAFAQGRGVASRGFPGRLPRATVLARARALVGRRWHLFFDNCEHFVRQAHGLRRESPQLQAAGALMVVSLAIAANTE